MQLKKRYVLRKHLTVGAMTVVMLASSLPALASDGDHEGRGKSRGFGQGLEMKADARLSAEDELAEGLGSELKAIKADFKAARVGVKAHASASATEDKRKREEVRACKSTADSLFREAVKKAQQERDASFRNAQAKYLAELKTARTVYHAAIGLTVSASGSVISASATASVEVRQAALERYRKSVEEAQRTFSTAKKAAREEYRKDVREAQDARRTATEGCRDNER